MMARALAALAWMSVAGLALARDALDEALEPLAPGSPLTLAIGRPNGDALAQKAKAELEPYLSRIMGRPVKVEIQKDTQALSAALADGKVDLAWTTPVAFVLASQRRPDVTAIAKAMRNGKLFYRAAFIVRADSPLRALADLKGKKIAWVSRSSTSGYLFPRALLSSQGHDPDRYFQSEIYAGDHPSVCQAVRSGAADLGATFSDEPRRGQPARADGCAESPPMADFRVVASSGPVPNDVIAARAGFDERLVEPVLTAFARMPADDEGRRILREVFHADGWGVAVEGDFKSVSEVLASRPRAAETPRKAKKPRR
jgi:phosphonate transport system substrate-binding protein